VPAFIADESERCKTGAITDRNSADRRRGHCALPATAIYPHFLTAGNNPEPIFGRRLLKGLSF